MTAPVIAVLDTDPSFLSLMHELLTEEGYAPLRWQASEWVRAHAVLRRLQPALMILDFWLDERDDGWAFLKRLWGDVDTTHIPVVIVTGEPESLPVPVDVLHALHCHVVRKPFDVQDLLDAIAAVLGPSPVQQRRSPHLSAIPSADPSAANLPDYPLAADGA
jgi:DNA-binding response OmpR family regulator